LRNTGQAVRPCRIAECDPRQPYRVSGSTVKFLTYEPNQANADLDGNNSHTDLVLQTYDFCSITPPPIRPVPEGGGETPLNPHQGSTVLLSNAGRCDLGVTCDPNNDQCGNGAYCDNDTCDVDAGTCRLHTSIACSTDTTCKRCILRQPAS